jgi:hypothetical protein
VIFGKVLDPEFRRWGYLAYCNNQFPNETQALAPRFRDEYDAMFGNMA